MSMIPDICRMHILLAAATSFEIQPTIDFLKTGPSGTVDQRPFPLSGTNAPPSDASNLLADSRYPLPGSRHEAGVLITGIGAVATTYSLMRQIGRRKPDIVIQAGIAGCFTGLPPGEVMVTEEEYLADLGVWEGGQFNTLFDLKLAQPDIPPFSRGLLINPYKKLLALSGLLPVRAATVNEISTDKTRIEWLQQNTAPVVESMEGGGLHYVCLQENIAFLQLRSVSNDVGIRDKAKWDIKAAITSLNTQLINLFKQLAEQDDTVIDL